MRESVSADVEDIRAEVAERLRDVIDSSAGSSIASRVPCSPSAAVGGRVRGFGFLSFEGETWIATNYHVVDDAFRKNRHTVLVVHGD